MILSGIKKIFEYILLMALLLSAISLLASYKLRSVRIEVGAEAESQALDLLMARKDKEALVLFEKLLAENPRNTDALWGKGEVFRRDYRHDEAEAIFNGILKDDPRHVASLLSMAYIRFKDDDLKSAARFVNRALVSPDITSKGKALAYMILGTINSRRSQKGWFLSKLAYGTQIKGYFLKAKALAPELPEVRLGLGSFYLLAPEVIGGDLDKAVEELDFAVKLAPDFATANVRLAQAYRRKGDQKKYDLYMQKARELDPGGEDLDDANSNDKSKTGQ